MADRDSENLERIRELLEAKFGDKTDSSSGGSDGLPGWCGVILVILFLMVVVGFVQDVIGLP